MSIRYELLKTIVKTMGLRNTFAGDPDEIIARMKEENAKNSIPELNDDNIDITQTEVMGCPVLKMIHKQKTKYANLFIIGGGMVRAPQPSAIKKALNISRQTGLDLYVPYYPLCTDYPVTKAYEMIHETYKTMLQDYDAKYISILGTSSGGNLALGIPAYINAQKADVPMPAGIIAISPGTCPDTEEEWQRMQALDEKDILIPVEFMRSAEIIMKHGETDIPDYMIHLQNGDFTGCPHVTFMYGSDEVLYGCAPSFGKAMEKYHVNYDLIVGDGMFHVYPVFPLCPEAQDGWDQMVRILSGN